MPVITDLKPQRREGYISVMVDGEFVCGLSDYQIALHGLHVGDEISTERIVELQSSSEAGKAYAAALRFLSYRMRSIGEVKEYLTRKGFGIDITQPLLQRLIEEKYLDDEDFAKRWVQMRIEQNRSIATIRLELIKKKIERNLIDVSLQDIDQVVVYQQIERLIQKKRSQYESLEKLIQYLLRKGFRFGDIKQVLAELE